MKTCYICELDKPLSEYYRKGKGYDHRCKDCVQVYQKSRRPKQANIDMIFCEVCGEEVKIRGRKRNHKYCDECRMTMRSQALERGYRNFKANSRRKKWQQKRIQMVKGR